MPYHPTPALQRTAATVQDDLFLMKVFTFDATDVIDPSYVIMDQRETVLDLKLSILRNYLYETTLPEDRIRLTLRSITSDGMPGTTYVMSEPGRREIHEALLVKDKHPLGKIFNGNFTALVEIVPLAPRTKTLPTP